MTRALGTRPLLALVCALVLGVAMIPARADPAPAGERGDGGPGGYIVVLDHGDPDRVAQEHRRDHDAQVRHVYHHALKGYAAHMSERDPALGPSDNEFWA